MTMDGSVIDKLRTLGVVVRPKSDSRLMRFLGKLLPAAFMTRMWTTISRDTIWAPRGVDLSSLERYRLIIEHELVHIEQVRRRPVWWRVSWLFVFLPVFLAWFRWRWEREAYLVSIRAAGMGSRSAEIDRCVDTLWRNYGWPWPRSLMRRWFERQEGVEAVRLRHGLLQRQMDLLVEWDAVPLYKTPPWTHGDPILGTPPIARIRGWFLRRHSHRIHVESTAWGWVLRRDEGTRFKSGYDVPIEGATDDVARALRHRDLIAALDRALYLEGRR